MNSQAQHGPINSRSNQAGLTLLELTVVVVIFGLLYSIGSPSMLGLMDTANKSKIAQILTDAQSALINFSATNYRLPCPADPDLVPGHSGYGLEDCNRDAGMVPHVTLVMDQAVLDTAMKPVRYVVYRVANGTASADADLAVAQNRVDNLGEDGLVNIWDFCKAVENGSTTLGTGEASISTEPFTNSANGCQGADSFVNQAFVMASSGNRDSSRPADGNDFDGINTATSTCFASPDQPWDTSYDDLVVATSFATLLGVLCQ
ncbi:MAG: type II secretion system protein [Magnetococcales bacterium]|nr:type II secretion system protein [Magnetococcales bacterium]